MENIFKISKRGIVAILTLCILLGIAGTYMNVNAMAEDTTVATEETAVATDETTAVAAEKITIPTEENTVATEETTVTTAGTTSELMPMMARGCCGDTYGTYAWSSIDSALAHYNMPASSVHECNVTYNGIHYSYYVQMDSFRIYVRLA